MWLKPSDNSRRYVEVYTSSLGTIVVEDASDNGRNSTTCAQGTAVLTGDTV